MWLIGGISAAKSETILTHQRAMKITDNILPAQLSIAKS